MVEVEEREDEQLKSGKCGRGRPSRRGEMGKRGEGRERGEVECGERTVMAD